MTPPQNSLELVCPVGNLPSLKKTVDNGAVDVLRISPQSKHTDKIINIFHECLYGQQTVQQAEKNLTSLMPVGTCNGY
jgi:hypothetical protein